MSKKTEEQILFLKQFKNPVVKLLAYIFKYRMKEFLVFIVCLLIAAIIILNKEQLIKIYPFSKIFSEEKKGDK